VSDNGPGIPLEQREQIFEKFHRIDSGDAKETYGFGLGLYVSRRLVEAMNGRIWVESEPGRGATFRFALPLAPLSP
jgi:signal transduction histidine kinase